MKKLKVVVISEKVIMANMAGCGRNHPQVCGARDCSFNGGSREN